VTGPQRVDAGAFDSTDWSRYLLGATSSGEPTRQAVVRNAEQVARLRADLDAARAELAEIEANVEVTQHYGWLLPDDSLVPAPRTSAQRVLELAALPGAHRRPVTWLVYTRVGPAEPLTRPNLQSEK
jgi:hypothetical protein